MLKGRLRLNLRYDGSSKGSWWRRTVCETPRGGLQNRAASSGSSSISPCVPFLSLSYPSLITPAQFSVPERVPEHVDSSSSSARAAIFPSVLTIIRERLAPLPRPARHTRIFPFCSHRALVSRQQLRQSFPNPRLSRALCVCVRRSAN